MQVSEIIAIVGVIIATMALLSALYLQRYRLQLERRKIEQEFELRRMQLDIDYQSTQRKRPPTTSSESLIVELLQRQVEAIGRLEQVSVGVAQSLASNLASPDEVAAESEGHQDHEALIREISHSLNTPISQIQAALYALKPDRPGSIELAAKRIDDSVQMCRAFLTAFRQVAHATVRWEPESVQEAMQAAVPVYAAQDSTSQVKIDLPERVSGYPNSQILALLFPLLENALEAAPSTGWITCSIADRESGNVALTVSNSVDEIPDLTRVMEPGYTTKENHDGLGLAVVQRLAHAIPGSEVSSSHVDNVVTFTITLPQGE